jgi:hypothetical protein
LSIGHDAIKRLIRSLTGHYAYLGLFPCSVQAQAADGTLDLLPDDLSIRGPGGLQGVKIRHGLPGFTVEVATGSRVMLGFDQGDRTKPYATLWDAGSVKRVVFNGGELPIATLGALVTSGGPGLIVTLMPVGTGVGAPPNNAIVAGVPCFLSFSAVPPLDVVTGSDCEPLYGSVSDGVPEFLG